MKLSWTSLKISIAGAKLSHLVQKDKIWDHGSMAEQARIIFYLVHKARTNGNIGSLKKQCSVSCFEKLNYELDELNRNKKAFIGSPILKEIAIIDVQPGKNNKPDMFCAMMRGYLKEGSTAEFKTDRGQKFMAKWSFIRQGDWWMLDEIRS
jgi:hypothetical protein